MGDDVTAHNEVWHLPGSTSITELLAIIAKQYLPGIAGYAGWRIYQDVGDRGQGLTLGLIYTGDHLRQERYLCKAGDYPQTVAELSCRAPVTMVRAAHLSGGATRPLWLTEVAAEATYSGVQPIRTAADGDNKAGLDWHTLRQLDALAVEREGPRRAWIRQHILTDGLPAAELFIARNIGALYGDMCPASMALAARDLLAVEGEPEDAFGALREDQAALGVVVAAFGAFEWGLSRGLRRRPPPRVGIIYLEYLAAQGYRLAPIEQYLAGQLDFDALATTIDNQDRWLG